MRCRGRLIANPPRNGPLPGVVLGDGDEPGVYVCRLISNHERRNQMRQTILAAACVGVLGMAIPTEVTAQDLQETLGRLLQGFQGQDREDQRGPRDGQQWREDDRRAGYSDRWEVRDRLRALDHTDQSLEAQQRQIEEDRHRIEIERRRLTR